MFIYTHVICVFIVNKNTYYFQMPTEYFQNRLYVRSQKISIRYLCHNLKNHNKKITELSSKIQSSLHGEKPY